MADSPTWHGMHCSLPGCWKATPNGATPCLQQSSSEDMAEGMKVLAIHRVFWKQVTSWAVMISVIIKEVLSNKLQVYLNGDSLGGRFSSTMSGMVMNLPSQRHSCIIRSVKPVPGLPYNRKISIRNNDNRCSASTAILSYYSKLAGGVAIDLEVWRRLLCHMSTMRLK